MLAAEERPAEVDIEHALPVVVRHVERRRHRIRARAVNEHIDMAETIVQFLKEAGDLVRNGDIGLHRKRIATMCADDRRRFFRRVRIALVGDHDIGTSLRKVRRDRLTDAARCAGNERDLAIQAKRVVDDRQRCWNRDHEMHSLMKNDEDSGESLWLHHGPGERGKRSGSCVQTSMARAQDSG